MTPEMPDTVPLEDDGIYIVLFAGGCDSKGPYWHFAIYINANGGQKYHATNWTPHDDFCRYWRFEVSYGHAVNWSDSLRLAMKIGSVKSKAQAATADALLRAVPVSKHGEYMPKYAKRFHCGIWVREALEVFNKAEIVQFTCSTEDIYREVLDEARRLSRIGLIGLCESDLTI